MLPFSLGSSVFSTVGGLIISVTKDYRFVIWIAWAVFCLGYGLMTQLDSHSSVYGLVLPFTPSLIAL